MLFVFYGFVKILLSTINCEIVKKTCKIIEVRHEKVCHQGFRPGPRVIKLFSCSTKLRLKFILSKIVKMLTIVGSVRRPVIDLGPVIDQLVVIGY